MDEEKKSGRFTEIKFGDLLFDAVICLNAKLPEADFYKNFNNIPIYAADGAAILLYRLGIKADYVVGDLDSFSKSPESIYFQSEKVIHDPDQDANDFEKILKFSKSMHKENLLIIGFHGGELEHTLNNWSVFMRFSKILNLCVFDESRYGIAVNEPISLNTNVGEMVSLIPQPESLLITENLRWELNNERLKLGEREGARNIALSNQIFIEPLEGELFLFFDARLPYAPEKKF